MKLKKNAILVIASHNQGKIPEIRELLSGFCLDVRGASEFHLDEPEETGTTFAENALIKARAATAATGHAAIADDSGLVVFALNGDPGIYSARWAGPNKDFQLAMKTIENQLRAKNATNFSAKFVCALALSAPNGEEEVYEGEVLGNLVFPSRGTNGFGYDPIFLAHGMTQTYGEIASKQKDAVNHRAEAFKKLKKMLVVE